jgi:hypothetical protein
LWLDEVALYFQIKARSYGALFRLGVGGNQGAPAAYLLLTKLAILSISTIEVATRLVAFVAGLGAVFTTSAIAVRAFKDTFTRVVACLLVSSSPLLIHYSSEGKQYMLDTFIASLVILAFLKYEAKECTLRTLLPLGIVVVWFAHSAPLVLCACGIVLMVREFKRREYRELFKLVAVASVWVVSFAFHASTNMRSLLSNGPLYMYWRSGLAPWNKGLVEVGAWAYSAWFNFLMFIFAPSTYRAGVDGETDRWIDLWVTILLAAMFLGLVQLWRKKSVIAPYVTSLFAIVFAIAACRLSPFSSRIILYLVPWVLFCLAACVGGVASASRGRLVRWGASAALLVVIGGVSFSISLTRFAYPLDKNDIKGAISFLSKERKPEEQLLIQDSDLRTFAVYARRYKLPWGRISTFRWSVNALPVTQARLVKAITASSTKSVWVVGAFRSYQVKESLAFIESGCCTVVKRQDTPGSVVALVVRKDKKALIGQRGQALPQNGPISGDR